jgi:hypothetical protein
MNRPGPHRGTLVICAALALVLVLCAVVASSSPIVAFALMPLIAGLLAIEVDRRGELLAERIVRLGGRLVPERARVDCVDEWIDHVLAADEGGLHPVWEAVQIALLAAPRIAGRRFLGRYLLGLMTAIQNIVWREEVDSPIQASKAMFRFWALAMVPVLAIPGGRRLKLPGWMIYGSAFLVQ